jgi:hypothetical protein
MLDEAREMATRLADESGLAHTACRGTVLALARGDYDRVATLGEEALAGFTALGEPDGYSAVLTRLCLGVVRLFRGDVDAAERMIQECRASCVARGEHTMQGSPW